MTSATSFVSKAVSKKNRKWVILGAIAVVVAGFIGFRSWKAAQTAVPKGIAWGNGRLEAQLVDISAKEPLRVKEVLVAEGDVVKPGQVLVRLDTVTLEAELAGAKAAVAAAQQQLAVAKAAIARKSSEIQLARIEATRSKKLVQDDAGSQREYDVRRMAVKTTTAGRAEEEARLRVATADVDVAQARVATIDTRIKDATLTSPVFGRVLYKLAEPGEVLGPGGKALTVVNLEDVYMEIFLPSDQAAAIKMGAEGRFTVDYDPNRAVGGFVSFVSPEAQFTPKEVETRSEREKLMFRVKIQVPKEVVAHYVERVKTGVRGVGYVKVNESAAWPEWLEKDVIRSDKSPLIGGQAISSSAPPVVAVEGVNHRYGKVVALDGISVEIPRGQMVGVIGPDGVGKSTLLALIAGSKKVQDGNITVLDGDIRDVRHRREVCPRIAYMPQGLGKNLYLELSVYDNVDFMAQLFGLSAEERKVRVKELLEATGLAPFPDRPAGKLSGGMKQKVGLCGALVHDPDLLILDEPTTGVDPLSRRQFWSLIDDIRKSRTGMSVVVATAYMDEAQRWDHIIAMDAGRVLAVGSPGELMRQTGTTDLEKCFIRLLPEEKRMGHTELTIPPRAGTTEIAIEADGLTRRFGTFTAVDHVTLSIERGEIFGFLGSNGCGKSTTMKMLTGLLPPTEGTATLFGNSVEAGSMEVRNNLGYMTQAFSLWGELTVRQNLVLDARLYHLSPEKTKARIEELVQRFGLGPHLDSLAEDLPMGVRQRLSLAVAVLHEPELLILDEPTSGVDPIARDSFWELLIDLSRKQGVTIFVTTHFMNEGMRCDRISLMHSGKVLACDAPQKLITDRGVASLEDAFIGYMEDAIGEAGAAPAPAPATAPALKPAETPARPAPKQRALPVRRMLAYSRNETMQILRDPVRLAFAFIGSALLMLVFGFGITTDVEHIRYAIFDHDQSPESRAYLEQFTGSPRYFAEDQPARSDDESLTRLRADDISLLVEIPPNFGRDHRRGNPPEVLAQVDGAMPFRGETVRQYVRGVHQTLLTDPASQLEAGPKKFSAQVQARFMYNPTFESIYSIVPSVPALLLILIPAILMTVSIVREKELGSIINFYVTPTGRLEYLIGKQLPYIAIAMINFVILALLALIVFSVPIKGSLLVLTLCTLLYVIVTTLVGMVTSTFTKTQVAAVFITAILTIQPTVQFAGLLQPVSTLEGGAKIIGKIWPTTYYMHSSLGAYTKGLGAHLMVTDLVVLLCTIPILFIISMIGLKKQDR